MTFFIIVQKVVSNFWATFVSKFIVHTFQKLFNLFTLAQCGLERRCPCERQSPARMISTVGRPAKCLAKESGQVVRHCFIKLGMESFWEILEAFCAKSKVKKAAANKGRKESSNNEEKEKTIKKSFFSRNEKNGAVGHSVQIVFAYTFFSLVLSKKNLCPV